MIKSFIKFVILLPFCAFSSVGPTVEIFGKIIKYDGKTVIISQEDRNGKREVTVPKNSIPKHFKMQTGQCVYSILEYKEFMNNIRALQEKAKNRQSKMKRLQDNMSN